MFYGANVENAAYPMGICAERSSLVSAISEGYQPGDFESITVTSMLINHHPHVAHVASDDGTL